MLEFFKVYITKDFKINIKALDIFFNEMKWIRKLFVVS